MASGGMPHAMHMEIETASCGPEPRKDRKMGSTILDCFSRIVNDKQQERLNGVVDLIRHMYEKKSNDEESKELSYALTRLVRGLGSSRVTSRKGFYTTLTAYLKTNPDTRVDELMKIMDAELHAVNSSHKSEKADVFMGRILLCGALIRSNLVQSCTVEEQQKIFEVLFSAGRQRCYLSFVSVFFLIDYLDRSDVKSLKHGIWPLLKTEFGKPWAEQTLDTLYVLLRMSEKFPTLVNAKFLKEHLGSENIIDTEHMSALSKLLTDIPRVVCNRHPVYKLFCEKLVASDHLVEFWTGIEERFVKPSISLELLSLELFKHILTNLKDKTLLPSLLTPNFLQRMLKRFTTIKIHKTDELAVGFRAILTQLVSVMNDKDIKAKTQVSVLKKLILYPGDLLIEKTTGTKVVQMLTAHMDTDGVKKLSKLYRDMASNSKLKDKRGDVTEPWTNAERTYAAQLLTRLLGHPAVNTEHKWRLDQLKFLFNLGLCETSNVGVELAPQFKESFYRALDYKLPKLSDLQTVLSELIHHLNDELFVKKSSTLRTPLTDAAIEAWQKMIHFITNLESDSRNKEVALIFYTMDLNMGLQLFSDSEMAVSAINEIHSCSARLSVKKSNKSKKNVDDSGEEPHWTEVIVDLLLSWLSRNSHLLRSLVGFVFPHMCPVLTAASIHQILSVLDPKNDKSPLVPKGDENRDDSSTDGEDSDSDEDDDKKNSSSDIVKPENDSESNSDKDTSGDEDDDDDDDNDDDDDEETVTDRLRLAVRQALGDACVQTDDEDIDVDQIDEEQGKRLDESLAAAFRILRENRQTPSKKQEKSAEALTHFRVRVMDLLETYVDSGPSMGLALDMLVPLFALLEYCIKDPHQKPLECRVRSCLKKLSAVKKFKDTEGVDAQLLTDVLKLLMEKGERSTAICQEMGDKLAECATFLVKCVQQAGLPAETLVQIYGENLTAFFKKRDCVLPANLFRNALQIVWDGNWQLAPLLVDYAFDNTIRSFRRGQAFEFLTIFYSNNRLVNSESHNSVRLKMEKKLYANSISLMNEMGAAQQSVNGDTEQDKSSEISKSKVKQKFVGLFFNLLQVVHRQHLPKAWDWKVVADAITEYRTRVSLKGDAKTAYNRLASRIGARTNMSTKTKEPVKVSSTNGKEVKHENGLSGPEMESEDEDSSTEDKKSRNEAKKKSKIRSKRKDKQKLKKEARELRTKAMSEGLVSFDFSTVNFANGITEEPPMENGVSDDETKSSSSMKKRSNHEPVASPAKAKKKKKNSEAKQ